MHLRRVFSNIFLVVFATVAAPTQSDSTNSAKSVEKGDHDLSLAEAVRIGLDNNLSLHAGQAKAQGALGAEIIARAYPNPELELSTEEWPATGGRGARDAKQTVGISQTFPWPGKRRTALKASRQSARMREWEMEADRREITLRITEEFCRVLALEAKSQAARELLRFAGNTSDNLRRRVEAGASPEQEWLRAQIRVRQIQNEQEDFEQQTEAARSVLSRLMGLNGVCSRPLGPLPESRAVAVEELGAEDWLAAHPAIAAGKAGVQAAEFRTMRARMEPYPDLSIAAAGGVEGPERKGIVEFRFSLPLPIFDRKKGQKMEAEAELMEARLRLEATKQQLKVSWLLARSRLVYSASQLQALQETTIPKSRDALRLVQAGFDEGKFALMDLFDTQRTTTDLLISCQDKLLELNLARAQLAALRGMNINDIGVPRQPNRPSKARL